MRAEHLAGVVHSIAFADDIVMEQERVFCCSACGERFRFVCRAEG